MLKLWPTISPLVRQHVEERIWDEYFSTAEIFEDGISIEIRAEDESGQIAIKRNEKLIQWAVESSSSLHGIEVPEVRYTWTTSPESQNTAQLSLFGSVDAPVDARVEEAPVEQAAFQLTAPSAKSAPRVGKEPAKPLAERCEDAGLMPDFTFDKYVVGGSNELAFGAARAVAESPGTAYNPLVIYGGVGLGKTHLLHAVGHSVMATDPTARVRYLSAESFVNQLVQAVQSNRNAEFRQRTRDEVDLLLIDDIQFIAGKERTQEEFFHMFNSLHQAGKQIIVTSDRIPVEIYKLQERIQSRLNMGLITDIQPPDLETRMAIIRRRAEGMNFTPDDDIVEMIARAARSNVRELHGLLNRLEVITGHTNRTLTRELVRGQLRVFYKDEFQRPTPQRILNATAEYFHLDVDRILGRRRTKKIAEPRKIAMYLCKQLTESSYPELGRFFGGRDHTTVLSGCKSVEKSIESDFEIRQAIEGIKRALGVD